MVDYFELYGKCREVGYCVCGGQNFCYDPLLLVPTPKSVTPSRIVKHSSLTIVTIKTVDKGAK